MSNVYATTGSPTATTRFAPDPPRLPSLVLLILSVVTLNLFLIIWGFRITGWLRKIDPSAKAIIWWSVYAVWYCLTGGILLLMSIGAQQEINDGGDPETVHSVVAFFQFIFDLNVVPYWIAAFSARGSLNRYFTSVEPLGLEVGGFLTFFFNMIYIQYKFNEMVKRRRAGLQAPAYQAAMPQPSPWQTPAPLPPTQAPAPGLLSLQIAGQSYALQLGVALTAAQIPGLNPNSSSNVVAEVSSNPANPSVVGLRNQSQQTWHVTLPGGEAAQIGSGQTIRLSRGTQFWFGQIAGVVV